MSDEVLRALRNDITNGRRSDALETIDRLERSFESDRAATDRDDVLATAVRYNSESDSEPAAAADEYLQTATQLEQTRIELNDAIIGYIAEEIEPGTLVSQIDSAIRQYDKLRSARDTLAKHVANVGIEVVLHLKDLDRVRVPKDGSVGIGTSLANLGNEVENSIRIAVEDATAVSTMVSPTTIDSLAGDDQQSIGISLKGESLEEDRVRLVAEGDTTRESVDFGVEVLSKIDYLSRALAIVARLLSDLEERTDATGPGNTNGLQNRIEGIRGRLERLVNEAEEELSPRKSLDNRVGSVINRLESVQKTISKHHKEPLNAAVRSEYETLIGEAIDLLEESSDASL